MYILYTVHIPIHIYSDALNINASQNSGLHGQSHIENTKDYDIPSWIDKT